MPRRYVPIGFVSPRVSILCGLVALLLLASGCNRPWRDGYFDKGLQRVTQAEVQDRLGPPHTNRTLLLGEESVWTYRYAMSEDEMDPWRGMGKTAAKAGASAAAIVGQGAEVSKYPTLHCQKYTLKFDKDKVLTEWKREACGLPAPATP